MHEPSTLPSIQAHNTPRTVIVLTLLALAVMWSFVGYWAISSRDDAIKNTGEVLRRMNHGVEEQTRRLFTLADVFLTTCDLWLEANPKSDPQTDPNFTRLIDEFRVKTGKTVDIFLVARNGDVIEIPASPTKALANVMDRDYFRGALAQQEQKLFIGKPLISRLSGHQGLPVALRLKSTSHNIAVALAVIDLSTLAALYDAQREKPDGAIVLLRRDGIVLASAPADQSLAGQSVAGGKIFSEHLPDKPSNLVLLEATATDGLKKLTSYSTMTDYPLVVVVSSAYDNALASWKKQAALTLLITLAISFAAGVVAYRSVRLLNALAQHNSALLHLAMTDVLTGVSNRRHFVEVLEHEFVRARRYNTPLSVLAFDLDFFKRINDGYGHAVGDEALTSFAQVAKQGLRDMDLLGRLGGEEFSIFLPNTTMAEALVVAERVRDGVTRIAIPTDNGTLKFTTSVGVAEIHQTDSSVDDLLRRADAALYDAKAAGRNRVATGLTA